MSIPKKRPLHPLAKLDHGYVWHPFTQMRDWLKREPIVITSGKGAVLADIHGKEYLDANSSIWTNLHGHNHPALNRAIQQQLRKIAHSSALGLANEPASVLASELIKAATPQWDNKSHPFPQLAKVFFSDNGSTAIEVALKLAYQHLVRKRTGKALRFLALDGAYHGDTIGAVSLGHIDLFHKAYSGLLFKSDKTPAPYCYRCAFNRAKPEHIDARDSRKCDWECLDTLEQRFVRQKKKRQPYDAFVFEPLVQGAAGIIPQPVGWLRQASEIARRHGALVIADEVLTGFGRCGSRLRLSVAEDINSVPDAHPHTRDRAGNSAQAPRLFACHLENVQPDLMALAKGLTGGYLPMAATLISQSIFDSFLGEYSEFKTFFHGHSYTGNQLGAAVAQASLRRLQTPESMRQRIKLERAMSSELKQLWSSPYVGDIRQVGLIAGVEVVRNCKTREPFSLAEQAGFRVCEEMAKNGVLTRPIGNVIVLMPPYCTTRQQLGRIVSSLCSAITATFK